MIFIDTNVAIAFRDGDPETRERVALLPEWPSLSIMTRIELEGGVFRGGDPVVRRALLERILRSFVVEVVVEQDVIAYGEIVKTLGHDRRLTLDRLIAAQAITRDAPLITRNGKDFRKIGKLKLVEWDTPVSP